MIEPMSKRVPQLLVALVALFGAIAITVVVVDRGTDGGATPSSPVEIGEQLAPRDEAVRSARRFLDTYVRSDGRVVRTGDDDTVSEGQAYAMLLALAVDDPEIFESVWSWTRTNLRGESGTLAWRWKDGAILDPNAATDADVDAARALLMAAERFDDATYRDDGVALVDALYSENVVEAGDASMLVAGPWATEAPYTWNPSYLSPAAFDVLAAATGNPGWTNVRDDGTDLLYSLTDGGERLPSNWARLGAGGDADVAPSPDGSETSFGFDAFRTLPRLTEACDERSRELAVALDTRATDAVDAASETTDLDANSNGGSANPLFLLSAAAGADATGDDERANSLADEAERIDAQSPSYYLGAWIALTRVIVDTDLLDVCGSLADYSGGAA